MYISYSSPRALIFKPLKQLICMFIEWAAAHPLRLWYRLLPEDDFCPLNHLFSKCQLLSELPRFHPPFTAFFFAPLCLLFFFLLSDLLSPTCPFKSLHFPAFLIRTGLGRVSASGKTRSTISIHSQRQSGAGPRRSIPVRYESQRLALSPGAACRTWGEIKSETPINKTELGCLAVPH